MKIVRQSRRYLATFLVSTGFVYPACALVCPKGIGGCLSPGKCFLFVDADGNDLCDYTSPAFSPTEPDSSFESFNESANPIAAGTDPVTPLQSAHLPVHSDTSWTDLLAAILDGPVLTMILIFLILAGIFFLLIRKGIAGIRECRTFPALALATVPALWICLIAGYGIYKDCINGTVPALVWITTGTLLATALWYTGTITRRIQLAMAGFGTVAGFIYLAPIMPLETGWLVNIVTGVPSSFPVLIALGSIFVLTLVFGRVFCGTICPVGALQELAYSLPSKKILVRRAAILESVRFVVFLATVTALIYHVDLMASTGLYDFFSLTITGGFLVSAGLVVLSIYLYRPVCRILCPFGFIFSILAQFSIFQLRQGPSCTGCGKCERACPVGVFGTGGQKRECYFCGRCLDACPEETALQYRR